ncbi:MAG: cupin domain-containing protein [bacterium]
MSTKNTLVAFAVLTILGLPVTLVAAEKQVLMQSSQSWDGGQFNYPDGQAQLKIVEVTLATGEKTPWHCHPVPVFGLVKSGTLKVETDQGQQIVFEGETPVIEVMATRHRGTAMGGPVTLIAFYAGAEGVETTHLLEKGEACPKP